MKHTIMASPEHETTYALLVRSEDREQSVSENVVYLVLILSAVFSLWFAAHQPVRLPVSAVNQSASIAQTEGMPQQPTI